MTQLQAKARLQAATDAEGAQAFLAQALKRAGFDATVSDDGVGDKFLDFISEEDIGRLLFKFDLKKVGVVQLDLEVIDASKYPFARLSLGGFAEGKGSKMVKDFEKRVQALIKILEKAVKANKGKLVVR